MKVNDPLDNILNSRVKIGCLRNLCSYPRELNGRELSRELGITPKSIHKAMGSLVDEGVVNFIPHGNSYGYSIKKDKWIVKRLLLPLFQSERVFLDEIIEKLKKEIESSLFKEHVLSVVLFGSVHHKKETNKSDFDVFILVDKEEGVSMLEEKMSIIAVKFVKTYGIDIGLYVKSLASFKKDRSLEVIKAIMLSNRLVYGQELSKYGR